MSALSSLVRYAIEWSNTAQCIAIPVLAFCVRESARRLTDNLCEHLLATVDYLSIEYRHVSVNRVNFERRYFKEIFFQHNKIS